MIVSAPCSAQSRIERWACALLSGARLELYLTPKPGLVDRENNGSHPDLSLNLMEQSLEILAVFLDESQRSLVKGDPFSAQRKIGIETEHRLLSSLGTNTHKGYVFLSGMLLNACWRADSDSEADLRRCLAELSQDFFRIPAIGQTHGQSARVSYGSDGIVGEAMRGFPSLFEAALPGFRRAYARSRSVETASFNALACLMQSVEDTTTLHRAGPSGLRRVRHDGSELERRIARDEPVLEFLRTLDRIYIEQNLTIGGIADMLGLCFATLIARGEYPGQS